MQVASLPTIRGGNANTFLAGFAIDGTTGYFLTSGGSGGLLPQFTQVTGLGTSNSQSVLVNGTTLGTIGLSSLASAGIDLTGTTLTVGQGGTGDFAYTVSTATTNTVAVLATKLSLDAALTNTGSDLFFGAYTVGGGGVTTYESDTDQIVKTTGTNAWSILASAPNANGLATDGTNYYFGDSTGIRKFDGFTTTLLVSNLQVQAVTGASGFTVSNTGLFSAPDGKLYFFESSSDSILSIDPAFGAGTLSTVLSQSQLAAGPAGRIGGVQQLGWFDGNLAFAVGTTNSAITAGFYAIPEPGTVVLISAGASLMLLRRRQHA